jgi:hypothetical protein
MSKIFASCLLCLILFGLVACGGGGSSTPTPTPTPVPTATPTPTPAPALAVTPAAATVALNGSQQFTATGTSAPASWSLSGPAGTTLGTISASGFYIAPAGFSPVGSFTATITATSLADSTKTATSALTVVYPNKNNVTQTALPIKLGSVGGNILDNTPPGVTPAGCCIGTLGSRLERAAAPFILSNNHVLARSGLAANGEAINQTRSCGGGTTVGNLAAQSVIKPVANDAAGCVQPTTATLCGAAPDNVDAAIASTTNANTDAAGTILELGAATATTIDDLPPSSTIAAPTIGMAVAKSGRTTGLTCSSIEAVAGSVAVDYENACGGTTAFQSHFNNQIMVTGGNFIESGDSGSLLVTQASAEPVGLLYASGGTSSVANPITTVIATMVAKTSPGLAFAAGNPDHPVSCQATSVIINSVQVAASAVTLNAQQRTLATAARDKHATTLMSDEAVRSVSVGASADNPKEAAVVIEISKATRQPIPAMVDGVRTRLVYTAGAVINTALSDQALQSTINVKEAHVNEYFGKQGIRAVAVGRSTDNPAEAAIIFYTTAGVTNMMIPAVIDGVRTRVIEGTPFRAR